MKRVLLVITVVAGVALFIGVGAALQYVLTPTYYEVTLVNQDTRAITGGELRVNEARRGLGALVPGASQTLRIAVQGDGHYVVAARWDDGTMTIDSTGYVTHGLGVSDSLAIGAGGLTMTRGASTRAR